MGTIGARSHGALPSCPGGWPGLLSGTHFRATLPLSHWAQHGDRPPRALWTPASVPPSCQSHSPGWASRFTSRWTTPQQGCRDHVRQGGTRPGRHPPAYSRHSLSAYCTDKALNSQRCRPLDQHTRWRRPATATGEMRPSCTRPSPHEQPGASVPGSERQAAGQGEASPVSTAGGPCLSPSCGRRAAADTPTLGARRSAHIGPWWGLRPAGSGLFLMRLLLR